VPRNWSRSVVNWNLALDSQGNPHNGGCGDASGWCTGVVSVDGSTVTRNAEYYTLGHLSRFVRPGAVRVGTPIVGDLQNVAFRNPDGSFALFVANAGGATQTFGVGYNGMFASYTLPPNGITTLTWPAGGTVPPTVPPPSIDPAAWYQVVNVNSGKCLDAAGWGTTNGTALQQWTCSATVANNQLWQFRPTTGGYYQVVNRHSGTLVWDVNGVATTDGAQVHLWGYVGGANQQWLPAARSGGGFTFTARHSGKCLDVRDVSTADGAWLQQWACTGGPAQGFTLVARA